MKLKTEFTQRYKKTVHNMQIMMIVDRVNLIILQIMDFNENEILHHFLDWIQPIISKESKKLKKSSEESFFDLKSYKRMDSPRK